MAFSALLLRSTVLVLVSVAATHGFNVSNTLGDGMVLQRAPGQAVVYGMGSPGVVVTTAFAGTNNTATVGADGIWRQKLAATPATKTPQVSVCRGVLRCRCAAAC